MKTTRNPVPSTSRPQIINGIIPLFNEHAVLRSSTRTFAALFALAMAMLAINARAASSTWTGAGVNDDWSTSGNWDTAPISPTALTFAGTTRLSNSNDLSNFTANSITFDVAAGAFVLNGNEITLGGSLGFSGNPLAPVTQTINLDMDWTISETLNTPTNGNLTLDGDITSGNDLSKTGAGTLTLGGTNSIENLDVNGGTNAILGSTTLVGNGSGNYDRFYVGDGDTIANCNGTLIIQPGAALTVSGTFNDAAVIGRDSGSGRVIQNGGTFNFNPGNNQLFLIGASNSKNTQAEYDMNGGLFDLNNAKFGVGLGAGALITGLVNQVSGVITNVGDLDLGTLTANGYGIYNLSGGTIYIGSGGITSFNGLYAANLGGGTITAETSWASTLNLNLTGSNGPVTFNPAGNTITLSGILSGSGGLTVVGSGILELSGANTYTGDTLVATGSILQLDVTGSSGGAFRVANGGLLNLNNNGTYVVGSFYTNGVALPVGTYNSGNLPGFVTGSGNLQVASGISTGLWTGSGADSNWSTANNWNNNAVPVFPHALTFAGDSQLINNNDLSSITVSSLTFDVAAGAFVLNGNDISLSGNIGFNGNPAAPITQTVNLNMAWNTDKIIDTPTNGNLTLGGNITATANNVTKVDAGTLTLGGINSFAGYTLNAGTNIITGSTTVSGTGSSLFYLGNGDTTFDGTLVIQTGAVLNVVGSFGDAGVIGRNGGSGTIVQNGGTFTFNPANQTFLFVGATSDVGTHGEYDMNGGLLDMSSYTLGVALSDGGVSSTGVLNQAGGTIANLFKLDLGAVRLFGRGVYNLTGGTITIDFGGIVSDSGFYSINLGGGTIAASSGWASPLNMTLTGANGPVTFDPAGNTITLSGVLSGSGGLIVSGGGTLELSGANSYTGDTLVTNGTLQLDAAGSSAGSFRLVNGGLLNLNFSGTYIASGLYTNGVPVALGVYNSGNLPNFINGSGSVQVVGGVSTGNWTGLGTNDNWSTAGNWNNNAVPVFPIGVTFAGNKNLVNSNDLSGITLSSVTFDSAAGAFSLDGNSITLNGSIGFNNNPVAPVTQTVNLGMAWSVAETIDTPANGNLTLNGDLTSTVDTSLTKVDTGTLTLGGTNSILSWDLYGGTTTLTGNTAINGGGNSRVYVGDGDSVANCNGTLIIQPGATLSISGTFADALVIGRDSGSGTIIQNGGSFSFNPGNNQLFLIGASNNKNTRAEYDMNGGLFDLNNIKFGVGLGAGVLITGLVDQVSGVITNVGDLDLGTLTGNGYGVYNLSGGTIYIGSGGITTFNGLYAANLGGGTIAAEASWNSALNLNLTGNNGSVAFNPAGNTITLSGILSGIGGLTVAGGGILELSGANTYTGATLVNAGTLQLDSASTASSALKLANGTTLNLNFSGTCSVASFYTNNVALAPGIYTTANLPGFITGGGSLQVVGSLPNTPTSINFAVSNGHITISWPANYQGWILQMQTNSLSRGISTNWVDVTGTAGVTSTNIQISPATPTVFYRLRYPTP